jgi:hypothetical protein
MRYWYIYDIISKVLLQQVEEMFKLFLVVRILI